MIMNQKGRGVWNEFWALLEVQHRINRASLYDATHYFLKPTGVTDASLGGQGVLILEPFKYFSVFKAAADFPAKWISVHINVKETFALHEVLRLLVAQYSDRLSSTILVVNVESITIFHAFRKSHAGDKRMHDRIKSSFLVTNRL